MQSPPLLFFIESEADVRDALEWCKRLGASPQSAKWISCSEASHDAALVYKLECVDVCDLTDLDSIKIKAYVNAEEIIRQFCDHCECSAKDFREASAICMFFFTAQVLTYIEVVEAVRSQFTGHKLVALSNQGCIGLVRSGAGFGVNETLRRIVEIANGHQTPTRKMLDHCVRVIRDELQLRRRISAYFTRSAEVTKCLVAFDDSTNDLRRNIEVTALLRRKEYSQVPTLFFSVPSDEEAALVHPPHSFGSFPTHLPSLLAVWKLRTSVIPENTDSFLAIWSRFVTQPYVHGLREQFRELVRICFAECLAAQKRIQTVLKQSNAKVYFCSDHDGPFQRMCLLEAKTVGARTISFTHGGCFIHSAPARTLCAHNVLVAGPQIAKFSEEIGVDKSNITICGNPTISSLRKRVPAKIGNRRPKVIIILQGLLSWTDLYSPRLFRQTITELCHGLAAKNDWQIFIKGHPINKYAGFMQRLVKQCGSHFSFTDERWSREQFADFDLAIFPGGMSVTLLEMHALGVPVIYMRCALSKAELVIQKPVIDNAGVVTDSVSETLTTAHKALTEEAFRQSMVALGDKNLEKFCVSKPDVDPVSSILNLISSSSCSST